MALAILAIAHDARAAAPAGASIINVANLSYRLGEQTYGAASNPVAVKIGEIIDFSVTPLGAVTVPAGARARGVAFRLTNLGNGRRAFALSLDPGLTGDGFDPTTCQLYIDWTNAAVPDMSAVQLYVRGAEPELAAGQTVTVWAVCDTPENASGLGHVALIVRPVIASGDPAVPKWTPDHAEALNSYRVETGLDVDLVKTQSVVDAMGRPRAIKGSTVTYSLAATLRGQGTARSLTISDPIPAGARYVPGSLRLDGAVLTDADDGDLGQAGVEGIQVRLGDVPAPAVRTVTFQVLITP